LLEEEGIEFDRWGNVDMERFQWQGPDWAELDALLGERHSLSDEYEQRAEG